MKIQKRTIGEVELKDGSTRMVYAGFDAEGNRRLFPVDAKSEMDYLIASDFESGHFSAAFDRLSDDVTRQEAEEVEQEAADCLDEAEEEGWI